MHLQRVLASSAEMGDLHCCPVNMCGANIAVLFLPRDLGARLWHWHLALLGLETPRVWEDRTEPSPPMQPCVWEMPWPASV